MSSLEKFFDNIYHDRKITGLRLSNFAEDCLNRFIAQNTDSMYATVISRLTPALTEFRKDLTDVSVGVGSRKVKTRSLNEFMDHFKKTMSDEQVFIARKCGGEDSAAFLELYPNGLNEYWQATKTTMRLLVSRIYDVADKYATELGEDYFEMLQSFKTDWTAAVNAQETEMSNLDTDRSERGTARENMELALMFAMFTVGTKHTGDTDKCQSFFNFSLLHGVKHHQEETEEAPAS
jgi:hypothetical protein